MFHDFEQCLKPQGSLPIFFLLCFLFRSSLPKKVISESSCSKISQNSIGKPAVDFCFSCRAYSFISTEIELFSMLSLEFRSSYFSKYLRLIAVIRNSHRRCSIKTSMLHSLFDRVAGPQAIFKNTYFENICEGLLLFCVTLFLSTSIFQFHTKLLNSCSVFVIF